MRKIREVLRLTAAGVTARQVSRIVGIGVTLEVTPYARVIVSEPVLMQPRLRIEILARKYCEWPLP